MSSPDAPFSIASRNSRNVVLPGGAPAPPPRRRWGPYPTRRGRGQRTPPPGVGSAATGEAPPPPAAGVGRRQRGAGRPGEEARRFQLGRGPQALTLGVGALEHGGDLLVGLLEPL